MGIYEKQPSSRLDRTTVTNLSGGTTQFSTYFGSQTRQIRVTSTSAIWATVGSTAVITANSSAVLIPANLPEYFTVSPGQVLNWLATSTSSGYYTISEMAYSHRPAP
jgi:hypothetical protein